MIQVCLSAFFLYFLIEKMAGDDSPVKSKRVVGIVAVAFLVQFGLSLLSTNILWQALSLCVPGLIVWLALDVWCRLGRAISLKIAALYTAANFAFTIIVAIAYYKLARS